MIIDVLIFIGAVSIIFFIVMLYKATKLKIADAENYYQRNESDELFISYNQDKKLHHQSVDLKWHYNELFYNFGDSLNKRNLILLVGDSSFEKSMVVASLFYYMREKENVEVSNPMQAIVFDNIFNKLKNNNYFPNNLVEEFSFLDLKLKPKRKALNSVDLLFANLPTTNLNYVSSNSKLNILNSGSFDWALNSSHLLCITDVNKMSIDDNLFASFLSYYQKEHQDIKNKIKVMLVITDLAGLSVNDSKDPLHVVQKNMPMTYHIADQDFEFSVIFFAIDLLKKLNNKEKMNLPAAKKLIGEIYKDITDSNFY